MIIGKKYTISVFHFAILKL